MLARGVPNGPDEDLGELRSTLIAALGTAQQRVGIITPIFCRTMRSLKHSISLPCVEYGWIFCCPK